MNERQEPDKSETRATRVQHECNINATRMTLVKTLDFDNNTSEKMFSHSYISYMTNKRLQEEEQFHSRNYRLEMLSSHNKMHLKSASIKLSFEMTKAISKSYTLDWAAKVLARSSIVTHSNRASFLIKTNLYETKNILFSKNHWKLGKMNARFWKNI